MVSQGISWCEYNFFVSLLLHVKVLQFKLHLFYEISFLEIKKLNIAKDQEKLPKYNLESHIKYQVTHKSCNGRIRIFGECFAVCQHFAVCFWCSTRQKCNICRVSFVYRVPCAQLFAVRCTFDTRQMRRLPCARHMAHGKSFGTRQSGRFRSGWRREKKRLSAFSSMITLEWNTYRILTNKMSACLPYI